MKKLTKEELEYQIKDIDSLIEEVDVMADRINFHLGFTARYYTERNSSLKRYLRRKKEQLISEAYEEGVIS